MPTQTNINDGSQKQRMKRVNKLLGLIITAVVVLATNNVSSATDSENEEFQSYDAPSSPSGFKDPPAQLIQFLESNKVSELLPIPTADQLKQAGLTEQQFKGDTGSAWVPNTTDPSLSGADADGPYRITNGLFRVTFSENFRRTKAPTFFIGETFRKRMADGEAFDFVESRFGRIKLSQYEHFYGMGRVRCSRPYYYKFKGRFYSILVEPVGTTDGFGSSEKRSRGFQETAIIITISDVTFCVESDK